MLRAAFPCPPPTQLRERPNMAAAAPRAPWRGGHGGWVPRGPRRTARPAGRTRGRGTPGSEARTPGPAALRGLQLPEGSAVRRGLPLRHYEWGARRRRTLRARGSWRTGRRRSGRRVAREWRWGGMGLAVPAVPCPLPRAFGLHRPSGLTLPGLKRDKGSGSVSGSWLGEIRVS